MWDPTSIDPKIEAKMAANERYLSALISPLEDGEEAVRAIVDGGPPNVEALASYAQAMEVLLAEIAAGRVSDSSPPTDDDVRAVQQLVAIARVNAPRDELVTLARRVLRMTADERTRVAASADESPDRGQQIAEAVTEGFTCCREVVSALKASAQVPDPKWIEKLQAMDEAFSAISAGELGPTTAVTPERLHLVRRLRSLVALWAESGQAPEGMQALVEGLFTAFRSPTS